MGQWHCKELLCLLISVPWAFFCWWGISSEHWLKGFLGQMHLSMWQIKHCHWGNIFPLLPLPLSLPASWGPRWRPAVLASAHHIIYSAILHDSQMLTRKLDLDLAFPPHRKVIGKIRNGDRIVWAVTRPCHSSLWSNSQWVMRLLQSFALSCALLKNCPQVVVIIGLLKLHVFAKLLPQRAE